MLQAQPKEYMTHLYVQLDHNGKDGKGEIDCTFDRYPARHRHFGTANTKSIGQLLIEFFEFYSRYFDYKTMEVNIRLGGGIRMRDEVVDAIATGKSPKNGKGPIKLVVMDPFLKDRNVSGGCKAHKLTKVWEVFEALYLILSRGEFEAAFELMPGFQEESGWRHRTSPKRRTTAPATKVDGTAPQRQKQTNMDNKDHQKARVALPQVAPASAAPTHPVELAHVYASAPLRTTSSMKAQTAREAQSPASLRVQSTSTGEATMVSGAASVRAVSTMNQTSSGRRQQRRTAAVAATDAGSSTPSILSVPSTVRPLNPYIAHPSQQKLSSKKKKDLNQEHGRAAPKVPVTSQTNLANALSGVQQQPQQPQQPQQQKQKQKLQENQQKQQQQRQQTQSRQS